MEVASIPGNIRIKVKEKSRLNPNLIRREIKRIPGVVNVWYVHNSKQFDMLADIEVQNYEQVEKIKSALKHKHYVEDIDTLVSSSLQ
ncbi:MAG: hypothetical protein M3275_00090 [Thermoproteota archaeon]|nr:hypothetical protein [Thermoproteota archaeon]